MDIGKEEEDNRQEKRGDWSEKKDFGQEHRGFQSRKKRILLKKKIGYRS